jgi:hypothetical protein
MACAVLVGCAGCATRGQQELPAHLTRAGQIIHEHLENAVIPLVDLENVRVDQALVYWAAESRTYQPLHSKFPYIPTFPPPPKNPVPTVGLSTNATQETSLDYLPKVTVRRRNITSQRLLDEICHEANLVWRITGAVILVTPAPTPPDAQK